MSDSLGPIKTIAIRTIGVGICSVGVYYIYKHLTKRDDPPKKWKKIGILEELCFYPIKSCGEAVVDFLECHNIGLRKTSLIKDRMFMLVNEDNELVSTPTYPKMLKIIPKIGPASLLVTAPGMIDLKIDLGNIHLGPKIKCKVGRHSIPVIECDKHYNNWFSMFVLGNNDGLRLVYYPSEAAKLSKIEKLLQTKAFLSTDQGSLQEVSSYMVINQSSVDDLNKRLPEKKINAKQFRGNFIVKTLPDDKPYDEDNWKWMKIGQKATFRALAPCYRCIFPNISINGERDPDGEPLKALKTYRAWGQSKDPRFGIQFGLRNPGTVRKGDEVFIEDASI